MSATITVVCPKCRNRMRASSEYIGRQGRCPSCKALIEIQPSQDIESLASLHPDTGASWQQTVQDGTGTTDVSTWLAGALGVLLTGLLYAGLFWPLRQTTLGALFVDRGPIPYVTLLVTLWGSSILALKYLAVKKQLGYTARELELIPLEIGVQITQGNINQFLAHLAGLPYTQRTGILGRRIRGALEHFKWRNSVPEVQQYLSTQAEIDASQVDSGYTLLRAFIWAVPILGFIGTVMGIGFAVSGLDASLGSDAGGSQLLQGMKDVTAGLSTAFDTTLIALCMAILMLFPTESLRKTEYRMLDRIEAFANESLLRRMSYEDAGPDLEKMPEIVCDALESAFREHQRWLAQWQAQVSELGSVVGADFENAVSSINSKLAKSESERLSEWQKLSSALSGVLEQAGKSTQQHVNAAQNVSRQLDEFVGAAQFLQKTLGENVLQCGKLLELQGRVSEDFAVTQLMDQLGGLKQEIDQLGARLEEIKRSSPAAPLPLEPNQKADFDPEGPTELFSRPRVFDRPKDQSE